MRIEITTEEYAKLLDLLFMASRVLTAHKEEDSRTEPYLQLIQRIYSLAPQTGRNDLVVVDEDLQQSLPATARDSSSEVRRLLDEFSDETFWHELVYRFSERDLERQAGGRDKLVLLTREERFGMETSLEERYLGEFSEHGIDRLEIVEHLALRGRPHKTSD
jgi:hypothetical protein